MSRAVSTPDTFRDSFASLYDRLNQPVPGAQEEDDAVRVSISGRGAAASAQERRRALAPVKVTARSHDRFESEATEISYEKALRMISRHRSATLPEQDAPAPSAGSHPAEPEKTTQTRPTRQLSDPLESAAKAFSSSPAKSKAQSSKRKPDSRSESQDGRATSGKRVPQHARKASPSKEDGTHLAAQSAKRSRHDGSQPGQRPGDITAGAAVSRSRKETAGSSAGRKPETTEVVHAEMASVDNPRRRQKRQASTAANSVSPGRSRRQLRSLEARNDERILAPEGIEPATGLTRTKARSKTPETEPAFHAPSMQLEIVPPDSTLAQRSAIVSIRLNDMEFDRLRVRAAESGLSVSGYMRSCVLEAEHLRAQVKQALAEMRSSINMAPGLPPPAPPSLPILASEASPSAAVSWSRFLWRSATLVLGPLLAFRHRT